MASTVIKHLPELVAHNVITPATAKDIEQYYALKPQPENVSLLTIFASLGGILAGLGLILIFAHNWDTFSRTVKTLLALLPLLVFQLSTGYGIIKQKSMRWKSVSGTLLFFSVGASIAMVSQIYNIPGDLDSYLTTWIIVFLPLLYLLRSDTVAFLLLLFSTYYIAETGYYSYSHYTRWFYLLFIAAIVPYYVNLIKYRAGSHVTRAFNWLLPLSIIISFGCFIDNTYNFGFILYGLLLCLVYNMGMLPVFTKRESNGYSQLGSAGIVTVLLMMCFKWAWKFMENEVSMPDTALIITGVVLFTCSFAICYTTRKRLNGFNYAALAFPAIFIAGIVSVDAAWIISNSIALALSIDCICRGINRIDFKTLNFGLFIIAILIIYRFFDTDISFEVRGILFLVLGAGFFTANYFLAKKKKSLVKTTHYEN